ncbi:hypothetical protein [Microbacterium sp. G2-8]|uniref:hypothetical protein n=1 Tax=Microbacterium sp. G2-8 TaxID=2842454 RepID=UPI001C894516|nr:hypothetical protein [Microbacterium sp. G2-8]
MRRTSLALATLAALGLALAACASEAEPEPAWTEEEAFAAAEETFRAYWGSDFDSDEERLQYLNKEMAQQAEESERALADIDIERRGESVVTSFEAATFRTVGATAVVEAVACVDGTEVEVNIDGEGWEAPREEPQYAVEISFEASGSRMVVADLTEAGGVRC